MSRKTLLSVVQSMLIAAGSDQVNSIGDTTESEDIAVLAREVFYNVMTWDEWPANHALVTLEPVSEQSAPTTFRIKNDFKSIDRVQYLVKEPGKSYFANICWLEPEDFLSLSDSLIDHENTQTTTGYGINSSYATIRTDKAPQYYTTFDGEHIVLDSFNQEVDVTLQSSKLRVMAEVIPEFKIEDGYVINITNPDLMNLYLAELRQDVLYYFNQQVSNRDAKKSLRSIANLRHNKEKVMPDRYEEDVNFGRLGDGRYYGRFGRR